MAFYLAWGCCMTTIFLLAIVAAFYALGASLPADSTIKRFR